MAKYEETKKCKPFFEILYKVVNMEKVKLRLHNAESPPNKIPKTFNLVTVQHRQQSRTLQSIKRNQIFLHKIGNI